MTYEVGKPFPAANIWEGEAWQIDFTNSFFDIRYYKEELLPDAIQGWRSGKLRFGLYKRLSIPFLILDFKSQGAFAVDLNIFDIRTSDDIDRWLNQEGRTINAYLIHAASNIITARRTITLPFGMAEEIRDILEKQSNEYHSESEVQNVSDSIELEIEKMIERCHMVKEKL